MGQDDGPSRRLDGCGVTRAGEAHARDQHSEAGPAQFVTLGAKVVLGVFVPSVRPGYRGPGAAGPCCRLKISASAVPSPRWSQTCLTRTPASSCSLVTSNRRSSAGS